MRKFIDRFQISAAKLILQFCYGTGRWNIEGFHHVEKLMEEKKSFIIAFWHGRLFIPYFKLHKYHFYILAGMHRDAELGVRIGKKLGWRFLRGSSSDKGKEVFQEMVEFLSQPNNVLAITPDGPKGPAKIPKAGAIRAAQNTGVPIIPVGGQSSRHWSSTNWDTFYIAKPFSRIELWFGEPLYLKLGDDFQTCVNKLKTELDSLEQRANKLVT